MLKKTLKYRDLDGNLVEEDWYFGLTAADIAEQDISERGGMKERLQAVVASEDMVQVFATFKEFISMSVGRRVGNIFRRTPDIRDEFMGGEAYSVLFQWLFSATENAAEFINAIMPEEVASRARELAKSGKTVTDVALEELSGPQNPLNYGKPSPAEIEVARKVEDYSDEELVSMPQSEFLALVGKDHKKWGRRILQLAYQRGNYGA